MTDWLNHLVTEIHKTEGTFVDNPNTVEEIPFYEVGKILTGSPVFLDQFYL